MAALERLKRPTSILPESLKALRERGDLGAVDVRVGHDDDLLVARAGSLPLRQVPAPPPQAGRTL